MISHKWPPRSAARVSPHLLTPEPSFHENANHPPVVMASGTSRSSASATHKLSWLGVSASFVQDPSLIFCGTRASALEVAQAHTARYLTSITLPPLSRTKSRREAKHRGARWTPCRGVNREVKLNVVPGVTTYFLRECLGPCSQTFPSMTPDSTGWSSSKDSPRCCSSSYEPHRFPPSRLQLKNPYPLG